MFTIKGMMRIIKNMTFWSVSPHCTVLLMKGSYGTQRSSQLNKGTDGDIVAVILLKQNVQRLLLCLPLLQETGTGQSTQCSQYESSSLILYMWIKISYGDLLLS